MQIASGYIWDLKGLSKYEYSAPSFTSASSAVVFTGVANKRQYIQGFTLYSLLGVVATLMSTSNVIMWQFNLTANVQFTLDFGFFPVINLVRGEGLKLTHNNAAAVGFAVTVWGMIGD